MILPLFPLSAVLLPHGRMPLQIFERRYVDLVRDSMRSGEGFGILRLRRGSEVGSDDLPGLDPVGSVASIVDWDQLDNGLLGITVEGGARFRLQRHWRADSGLVMGEVSMLPAPTATPLDPDYRSLAELLEGLQAHPHVERIGMSPDLADAWQVAYGLLQLLPLDEAFKAQLLEADDVDLLLDSLAGVLGEMSGED